MYVFPKCSICNNNLNIAVHLKRQPSLVANMPQFREEEIIIKDCEFCANKKLQDERRELEEACQEAEVFMLKSMVIQDSKLLTNI